MSRSTNVNEWSFGRLVFVVPFSYEAIVDEVSMLLSWQKKKSMLLYLGFDYFNKQELMSKFLENFHKKLDHIFFFVTTIICGTWPLQHGR